MLLLTSTSDLIQVVTSTSSIYFVHASYVDTAAGTITPGRLNNYLAAVGTVTLVGSPAASAQRNVELLVIHATSGATGTVTIQHTDGTHVVRLASVALAVNEKLIFTERNGFQLIDASGALKQKQQPSPGRFLARSVYLSGSGNWTSPASCSTIRLTLIGGGGGGGGASSLAANAACAGGGGAGAMLELTIPVQPSTNYAYVVGAAGSAGTSAGGNGGAGGLSSFIVNGVTYSAPGGLGGIGQVNGTTEGGTLGGADTALSTNGGVNGAGSGGGMGWRRSGTLGWSGIGGGTLLGGGGGRPSIVGGGGVNASGIGGGGGGALVVNGSGSVVGGTGFAGAILIDQFS